MSYLTTICPKIRPLDFQPVNHQGEQVWLVRDPQEITSTQLILPPVLAQMTVYCDGLHDIPAIYAALERDLGGQIPQGALEEALETLDNACMLDNDRFQQKKSEVFNNKTTEEFRPMALAWLNYSQDLAELAEQFSAYGADDDAADLARWESWNGRGIVSPHIDYQRGGRVYAQTWARS